MHENTYGVTCACSGLVSRCFLKSDGFHPFIPQIAVVLLCMLDISEWTLGLNSLLVTDVKEDVISISSGQQRVIWHIIFFATQAVHMILLFFGHFRHGYEIVYGWELENYF